MSNTSWPGNQQLIDKAFSVILKLHRTILCLCHACLSEERLLSAPLAVL